MGASPMVQKMEQVMAKITKRRMKNVYCRLPKNRT